MPFFISVLITAIVNAVGTLIGRAIVALGFGFATYYGLDSLISSILDEIRSNFHGIPEPLVEWAGFFRIDQHITIMISGITTRVVMIGIQDGKKFIVGGRGGN